MALIPEDGSIVTDADTYAEATDLAAYAALRGITITAVEAEQEALLVKAMDYLARYRGQWKGNRVSDAQALDWPRSGVYVDNRLLPSDEIPRELFYAQISLAVAAESATLLPTAAAGEKGAIIEETVSGAVTLKYANPGRVLPVAADAYADALIAVLLKYSGLQVIRA